MIKPKEILEKNFSKSRLFGYKSTEVDDFLTLVFKDYETIFNEKNQLEDKVNFLADKLTEYRDQENKLTDVLLEAKKVSDNMLKKSKEQADLILSNAEIEAQKIIGESKKEAQRQQSLFVKLQRETNAFKNKLLSLYKSHVDLVATLPTCDVDEEDNSELISKKNALNDTKNIENISEKTNLKERTFSISLDKNGRPIDIKDETISSTQNISLNEDMKNISKKNEENSAPKFKEPLKFGLNYSFQSNSKKK